MRVNLNFSGGRLQKGGAKLPPPAGKGMPEAPPPVNETKKGVQPLAGEKACGEKTAAPEKTGDSITCCLKNGEECCLNSPFFNYQPDQSNDQNDNHHNDNDHNHDKYVLARAYVPLQKYGRTFGPARALIAGTLFPDLYRPYPY